MTDTDRNTSSGVPRLPVLDGYRAYAILAIVCIHVLWLSGALSATRGAAPSLIAWGLLANSIDAFFILTGFVLFLPVLARRGDLGSMRTYAIDRAARLVPAYWLVLVLMIVLVVYVPMSSPFGSPSLVNVAAHMSFLQMPARLFQTDFLLGFGINGPIWMLSVIVGFYVVFPVLARAYYRHPLVGLAVAAAITFGWKTAVNAFKPFFTAFGGESAPAWVVQLVTTDQLPGWAFSFALGMTGAWAYLRVLERYPRKVLASRAVLVGALALPVYALFAYLYGRAAYATSSPFSGSVARLSPWEMIGNSASRAVLMGAIALWPAFLLKPFVNRATTWLAEVSYGLYLIHFVVGIYMGWALGLPTDGTLGTVALWFLVVLPLSLLYAYLSLRLVERPVRRWVRSRRQRAAEREPPLGLRPAPERAPG